MTFAGTEFTTSGLLNSDSVTSVTLTSSGAAATASVAGSPYAITPSAAVGSGLANYSINYVNGALTVNTATLTITANNRTKNYGETVTFAGTEFTPSGLLNSDSVSSVTLTSAGAAATATVAGSPYTIVPSAAVGSGLGNYSISYVNGALTVNTAALTITANNRSKNYGETVTFAGNEFTTSGLANSDSVTSVTLTSSGAAASANVAGSPYAIVASDATGSGLANYSISYVDGSLTVNGAPLTVSANNRTKTYGDTVTFAGTEFTTSGLLNSDSVTSVTLTSSGAAATATVAGSPYSIVPSDATGSGLANYSISYVNGSLTVNTASLTITANNRTKTYGETVTFAGTEFTTSGLLNSDSVTSVTLTSAGAAATATVSGSPYSIAPSDATGSGLGNYSISYVNGSLTVNAASLTITADNRTKNYGETVTFAGTEFTTSGLLGSDSVTSVTLTSSGAAASASAAGSPYTIVPSDASGSGLGNYSISYVNGSLTVNAATLTITANNRTKTYGETVTFAGTEFTTSGLVNSDSVTSVTLTSSGAAASASLSGSPYAIVPSDATGSGLSNYSISYVNGSLTVNAASLTITANNRTKTYGDTVTFAGTEFTTSGLLNSDSVTSVTLTSSGAAAGAQVSGSPYAIVASNASGSGLTNYTITYSDGTLTINPAPLTVTAENKSKTYGASTPAFTVAYSGFVNGDDEADLGGTLAFSGDATTAVNAGTYTITPGGLTSTNYSITFAGGTLTIDPAALTVTADDKSSTYGAALPTFTASYTGFVNGDDSADLGGTLTFSGDATTAVNAGTYTITPGGLTSSNYTISFVNGTLTINTAALTVTADDKTITYGDALPAFTASYTGFVNGDDASDLSGTLAFSGTATSASDAGTYTITPGGFTSTNYTISFVNGTLTINTAALTVTADDASRAYGDANPTFTGNITGIVGGDPITATYSTTADETSGTGAYDIVPSLSDAGSGALANYSITVTNGTLTINAAPLTITANDASRVYGDANPAFTGVITGIRNGDAITATYSTTATVASVPNTYPITPAVQATAEVLANYDVTLINGTLTITNAPLSVTANDATRLYGAANPAFTGTISGIRNSDNITATYSTTATVTTGVGTAPIVPTLSDNGTGALAYYDVTSINGTLTITKAIPVVTWSDPADIVYGTLLGATQLNAGANVTGTFLYTPAAGTLLDAGTHVLSVSFTPADSVNYENVSGTTVSIDVTKAASSVAITGVDAEPSLVGEAATVQFALTATPSTTTGTITITDGVDGCTAFASATSCSIIFTTAGERTLIATYSGDGNFEGSTSAGVAHQVIYPAPSATLDGSAQICDGSDAVLNVQLTGSGPWTIRGPTASSRPSSPPRTSAPCVRSRPRRTRSTRSLTHSAPARPAARRPST